MSNILITGSSGFIGTNLTSFLKSKYYKIIPFSRKNGDNYDNINYDYINESEICSIIHTAGNAHNINSNFFYNYNIDTQLTIKLFDNFLKSNAKTFIYFSSIKAVKDHIDCILTEDIIPTPTSDYGKSKLDTENYIASYIAHKNKNIYILRPCMVHGPGNKGNLNLLYNIVKKGIPWPLAAFNNKRSFCSIDNLCFIINELIENEKIPSGVYNVADDEPFSTNELVILIAESLDKKPFIFKIPKFLVKGVSKLGDAFNLPLNSERLNKLIETYIVSNKKIINSINKPLPMNAKSGLLKTFESFNN
jgi:nucleoside-diphosphate-sugar epimerase